LQFINKVVSAWVSHLYRISFVLTDSHSFGGNKSLLTVAGQSSGATLIRGLLASPTASALFQKAWLHSDPMVSIFQLPGKQIFINVSKTYGFASMDALTNLQSAFFTNSGFSCGGTDLACQQAISTSDIINAQNGFFFQAEIGAIDISVVGGSPIRIVHDGSFVTTTLTGSSFPSTLKPIVVTTVNKEAGPAILAQHSDAVPGSDWDDIIDSSFPVNPDMVLSSTWYPAPADSVVDTRPELITLGTDQIWRCPTWTLARTWASLGGAVYTGVINIGNVYVDSIGNPFCDETDVCHEGDIEILVCLFFLLR
jgi:carboxylesterase type B